MKTRKILNARMDGAAGKKIHLLHLPQANGLAEGSRPLTINKKDCTKK